MLKSIKKLAIILLIVSIFFIVYKNISKQKEGYEFVMEYLKTHKTDKNVSFILQRNGKNLVSINSDEVIPLASMMKLIIAVEFAKQSAEGTIKVDQQIPLSDLEAYYIKDTDASNHPNWIRYLNEKNIIRNNQVTLEEIAKGMLQFSSNANADYLIDKLGLENINQTMKNLQLPHHQELYPLVSSLYVAGNLKKEENLTQNETLIKMKAMSQQEFARESIKIHQWMKNSTEFKQRNIPCLGDIEFQRIWSDNLPAASAKDYLLLMERLNRKDYFPQNVQKELDKIVEWPMENPNNKEWLIHVGQKGGSTAFLLTNSLYAKDKEGNMTELVFMFNDLNETDYMNLSEHYNDFVLKTLNDQKFRDLLIENLD
ncbi:MULTISPECIES: serine hydrolase [Bacillus]|uniref:D-alanyl-D-alanine carboxypeptidase n=2 Tax=Bacillus cereus group TaxID=86661 RepID=A0A2C1D4L0_BACCE|nr:MULTISPECIES: serine hydrolase [Bacillus cereus group]OFD69656.1 D-alanyl-D-alanine carboxypeptidase [Bacillus mycoides]OFD70851.1 D-alanyl-D-alanine carboxypeptidase [Bacillus mycoides]OFD71472.1 D-alanyl-D-alanine carboxypeptidase [Bacillus mycoides]PGS94947.1 D-alanyl-D-alanine carboxypeptidase [Bacillus cereus]